MKIDIRCQPSYSIAYVTLDHNESVLAERGALAVASDGIEAGFTTGSGGLVKAALRHGLGGEQFFMGRYTATVHGAWVALAPKYPGDIVSIRLEDGGLVAEQGALLACCGNVEVDVKYAGVRNIVLREGATALRVHGTGDVLLGSYGAVQRFDLGEGEGLIIDTGHFVAMSESCSMQIGLLGGTVSSAASGEGIVGRITGPGSVWIQTREERSAGNWLFPQRRQNTG